MHAIRTRMRRNSLTLTIEEFVVAAGFGLPDNALHPPVRDLNVEALIRTRRMQGYDVLQPLLLGLLIGGCVSATQLALNPINSLIQSCDERNLISCLH